MQFFIDGDQLAVVADDFIDLHESAALFLPLDSDDAVNILTTGLVDVDEMQNNYIVVERMSRLRNTCIEFGRLFIPLFERLLCNDRI